MLKTNIIAVNDHAAIKSTALNRPIMLILNLEELKILRDQIDEVVDQIHLYKEERESY